MKNKIIPPKNNPIKAKGINTRPSKNLIIK